MDKGTGEFSLLSAGSLLPSIPFIAFYRLVLYCTVSDQIDLLSERKVV